MSTAPKPSPYGAALLCRCPRCGKGALYSSYIKLAQRCDVCGLELAAFDIGDGAAIFVMFLVGFVAVPLILMMELHYSPPLWVHLVVDTLLIVGMSWYSLPRVKALLVAAIFANKAAEGRLDDQ